MKLKYKVNPKAKYLIIHGSCFEEEIPDVISIGRLYFDLYHDEGYLDLGFRICWELD